MCCMLIATNNYLYATLFPAEFFKSLEKCYLCVCEHHVVVRATWRVVLLYRFGDERFKQYSEEIQSESNYTVYWNVR